VQLDTQKPQSSSLVDSGMTGPGGGGGMVMQGIGVASGGGDV